MKKFPEITLIHKKCHWSFESLNAGQLVVLCGSQVTDGAFSNVCEGRTQEHCLTRPEHRQRPRADDPKLKYTTVYCTGGAYSIYEAAAARTNVEGVKKGSTS